MQATRALAGHPVARIVGRVSAVGGGPASATAAPLGNPARTLARRLRGAMSPRMAYVMGGILGVDFGARDRYGNACGRIVVTSDGFALGAMGNAFLGAVSDIRANVSGLLDHVNATPREREHAERCYRERVTRS
ncbi:MAG TPA: hypothetical protein VFV84_13730 [Burkholderiales bacterium]|nr:hypothetical protein [Burkholderiales bacterium]